MDKGLVEPIQGPGKDGIKSEVDQDHAAIHPEEA